VLCSVRGEKERGGERTKRTTWRNIWEVANEAQLSSARGTREGKGKRRREKGKKNSLERERGVKLGSKVASRGKEERQGVGIEGMGEEQDNSKSNTG